MTFDTDFVLVCIFRIALSFCAGFLLGLERKSRQRAVGLRTLILICISSTLLGILSFYIVCMGFGDGDPSRIAAGVVSGIGFLGGGAIMRQGMNIKGLTSAAIIWTASAVGLAIGAGLYVPSFTVLLGGLLSLIILEKFEERWFPAARAKKLQFTFTTDEIDMKQLRKLIEKAGFIVTDFNMQRNFTNHTTNLFYSVNAPKKDEFINLMEELKKIEYLTDFSLSE